MKKLLSLLLVLTMLLSMTAIAGATFSDVDENYAWAEGAINSLSDEKIITGYEDGTFQPGKSITRQEAIMLFSKALGASEEMNAPIVELAYGMYEADLGVCSTSYAVKQGAYLIYRDILSVEEVIDYLSTSNREKELKRYEAATLIAKALGADPWFKNNPDADTSMEFADVNDIPAKYIDYVYYTTTIGIMGSMDNDMFGPNVTVTRAQIAVMIRRILDTMEFEYYGGTIASVDTLHENISIKKTDGEIIKFAVSAACPIFLDGEKTLLSDLDAGMQVVVTFSQEALYEIDAITIFEDSTVSGVYKGRTTDNSGTKIKVSDISKPDKPVTSYKLAADVSITANGKETDDLASIKVDDYVTIKIENSLVVSIASQPKATSVSNVKVTAIDGATDDGVELSVIDNNDVVTKYIVDDDAVVTRNALKATITDVMIGDTVSLTLEYGIVHSIRASGLEKTLEGTIEEITISNQTSYITIINNGAKSKYVMARDCKVNLMGEEATIYDLRLGAYVKLKTSSSTVIEITTKAVETALQVTGTVKTVNASYGLVIIEMQTASGATVEKQLFVKSDTKILDSTTNKMITLKALKPGSVITAAGTEKVGVYEVNSIMILQ